jgi:hypothetical protein
MGDKCINEVFTAAEVDRIWGKSPGTTKVYCQRGAFTEIEARKSGGTWLVTREGAERVFGPRPKGVADAND